MTIQFLLLMYAQNFGHLKFLILLYRSTLMETNSLCMHNCVLAEEVYWIPEGYFLLEKEYTITKSSIDQNCTGYNEIEITYPVFSKDLKTAVIGFNSVDGAFIAVCILTNKKWTLVRKYYSWIY